MKGTSVGVGRCTNLEDHCITHANRTETKSFPRRRRTIITFKYGPLTHVWMIICPIITRRWMFRRWKHFRFKPAIMSRGLEGMKEVWTTVNGLDGVEGAVEAAAMMVMPSGGRLTMVFGGRQVATMSEE